MVVAGIEPFDVWKVHKIYIEVLRLVYFLTLWKQMLQIRKDGMP